MILLMFFSLKDKHRLESLKQLLTKEKDKDLKMMLPAIEQEWCDFHNISRSSFYHVSEMCKFVFDSFLISYPFYEWKTIYISTC